MRRENKNKIILFSGLSLVLALILGCTDIFAPPVKVVLDSPPDGSVLPEGNITFRWHLENARDGVSYKSTILFDKGVNPFDGWIEMSVIVGEATEYTEWMSAGWWSTGFEWGVRVESSDGHVYESEVRSAKIIKQ